MGITLSISPHGRPLAEFREDEPAGLLSESSQRHILASFQNGGSAGLLHLATGELQAPLPPPLAYAREFAREYLTRLCQMPQVDDGPVDPVPPPDVDALALQAPPMRGLEYLDASVLGEWWAELDEYVREQVRAAGGGVGAFLRERNPAWQMVGRVTFHLAENKRDAEHPFAFMASYTRRLSSQGRPQHVPLSAALQEYAGAKNRAGLLALLTPIQRAAERCAWVKELVESGGIYEPLAWTPRDAHALLRDVPALEESGLVVRVPDWWKRSRAPRPQVQVKIGEAARSRLGVDALVDFQVDVALGDQALKPGELRELMAGAGGLIRFRGQWVELDKEKLAAALAHWNRVQRDAAEEGISFFEGMRLLAGVPLGDDGSAAVPPDVRQWTGIAPGAWLERTLSELRGPDTGGGAVPRGLRATLRPYQEAGAHWLRFMTRLGLGACLADDMGLGKTVQVLALLLQAREKRQAPPSLLVLPASLIANWQSEVARFAPALRTFVAHPSEADVDLGDAAALGAAVGSADVVITTYGMLARSPALRERQWDLVVLDEAQAIKNAGARQTRAAKELRAGARVALTGTPIENRLSDLWSLFDFLNPGLLGTAKAFGAVVKQLAKLEPPDYAPLRALTAPYILRRLKTDKRVIADLPDKTEVRAFCNLAPEQAALYEQSVRELAQAIATVDGIQRRGIVLAYLTRLKQICNHPSHWTGDDAYDPARSGKFRRLTEICEELAERQQKALVFTQFREIARPLAEHLRTVFGAPGLVLHGGTPVAKRRDMVDAFQRDDGPSFFVLSLKAGGTGLNLTAASHVIHFDRWWNPAVEDQATDRAFRIGQTRGVMVHKLICEGTLEARLDEMLEAKKALARGIVGAGEGWITEMSDEQLAELMRLGADAVDEDK